MIMIILVNDGDQLIWSLLLINILLLMIYIVFYYNFDKIKLTQIIKFLQNLSLQSIYKVIIINNLILYLL